MTRGSPRTELRALGAPPAHDGRALAQLSALLVALAVALGVGLALGGSAWPTPGAVVVFALLAWFAVNRYTFFPSELAVTSESAVLLAAVVAFHADAPLLGPWCVAALVGPLDAVHWEQRSFSRMGFNAGHQVLAAVAAAFVYDEVVGRVSSSFDEWVGVPMAVAVYALVVWTIGVVALRVWSHLTTRAALRELLPLDWIVVPLGVLGACAGVAAGAHGWWALPLVLVPVAFVPELVLGHGRSLARAFATSVRVRVVVVAFAVTLALAPGAAASTDGWALTALGALLLACLAAVELLPAGRARIPPLAGGVTAVAVALVGLGVPWWSPTRTLAALAAGSIVAAVAVLTAPRAARGAEVARAGWALPLVTAVVTAALLVVRAGAAAAAVPVVVAVGAAALVAAWAAPPWHSQLLARVFATRRFTGRRVVLGALIAAGLAAGAGAARADPSEGVARACTALGALAATEVALAVAAVGTRQWRFHPRARRALACALVATSVALLVGVPLLAAHAPEWIVPAIASGGAVALLAGDGPARRGDAAARAVEHDPSSH